jgi:hypothetical protein
MLVGTMYYTYFDCWFLDYTRLYVCNLQTVLLYFSEGTLTNLFFVVALVCKLNYVFQWIIYILIQLTHEHNQFFFHDWKNSAFMSPCAFTSEQTHRQFWMVFFITTWSISFCWYPICLNCSAYASETIRDENAIKGKIGESKINVILFDVFLSVLVVMVLFAKWGRLRPGSVDYYYPPSKMYIFVYWCFLLCSAAQKVKGTIQEGSFGYHRDWSKLEHSIYSL